MKYILSLLSLFFSLNLAGESLSDVLKAIPIEHQQDLKYLFYQIFLQQDGAYTIFGDKPISSAVGFLVPKWEATLKSYPTKFGKSWETWQKYKHKFPIKKYLIISEKYPSKKSGAVAIYIYVINKKKL